MKVTIEPETDEEKAARQITTVAGLRSIVVMGVTYDAEVLRRPYSYSYGDLLDVLREFLPTAFEMACAVVASRHEHITDKD